MRRADPQPRSVIMTAVPAENRDVVVLITLTVRPEDQQAVVDTIRSAGDPAAVPGLRSISLLRSLDGTQVINHMRWASRDAFDDARAHLPVVGRTRAEVQEIVGDATTHLYEVVDLPAGRTTAAPDPRSDRRSR
jgi:heme-degrading monooxygenase HmoA